MGQQLPTLGYGPGGSIAHIVLLGFTTGAGTPPDEPDYASGVSPRIGIGLDGISTAPVLGLEIY